MRTEMLEESLTSVCTKMLQLVPANFLIKLVLVGGFNPSEKYARQIGSFPQEGVKIKHIWNHYLLVSHFPVLFILRLITSGTAGSSVSFDFWLFGARNRYHTKYLGFIKFSNRCGSLLQTNNNEHLHKEKTNGNRDLVTACFARLGIR